MSNTNYTPQDALTKLRQRLLDLSNKNLFLNHKVPFESKHSISFVNFNAKPIISELLRGAIIDLASIPAPIPSSLGPSHSKESWMTDTFKSYCLESSEDYLSNDKALLAFEFDIDIDKKLLKLQKKAKQAVEETGANSLFLTYGFLEYASEKDPDVKLLAPLINIPVEISQKDALSPYAVTYTGAPLLENFSIKERLSQELNLNLEEFPDFLDQDDIDFQSYFEGVEKSLCVKGWKIKKYLSLNNLPPLNMILFHDLREENWGKAGKDLLKTPSIAEILTKNVHEHESAQVYTYDIDSIDTSLPEYPLLIEEADSSQLNAVLNILNSNDNQVIIGPPGTGKSQTITNIIASLIHRGKKVLFISEKLAALDVVKQRLTKSGLAPFVMPLHNNKIAKKEVVMSLSEAMETAVEVEKPVEAQAIEDLRQKLAQYCYALNEIDTKNELSAFSSIWNSTHLKLTEKINFSFKNESIDNFFKNKKTILKLLHELKQVLADTGEISEDSYLFKIKSNKSDIFDFSVLSKDFATINQLQKELVLTLDRYDIPLNLDYPAFKTGLHESLKLIEFHEGIILDKEQYLLRGDTNNYDLLNKYSNVYRDLVNYSTKLDELLKNWGLSEPDILDSLNTDYLIDKVIALSNVPDKKSTLVLAKDTELEELLGVENLNLQGINWKGVSEFEIELNSFLSEFSDEFEYISDSIFLKQNQPILSEIVEIKEKIQELESASPLKFPTDQESLDQLLSSITVLVENTDSILKYLNKDWYSSLNTHRKYQKNITKKYSLKQKEQNLLELMNIYNLYVSLSEKIQNLKSCAALQQADVFFDCELLKKEIDFSLKWNPISMNIFGKPINTQIEKMRIFCQTPLKVYAIYSHLNVLKGLHSAENFQNTQLILEKLYQSYKTSKLVNKIDFGRFIELSKLQKAKQTCLNELQDTEFVAAGITAYNYQGRRGTSNFFRNLESLPVGDWLTKLSVTQDVDKNLRNLSSVSLEIVQKLEKLNTGLLSGLASLENKFGLTFEFQGYPKQFIKEDFSLLRSSVEHLELIPKWVKIKSLSEKLSDLNPELLNKIQGVALSASVIDNLSNSLQNQAYSTFSENLITSNTILSDSLAGQSQKQVEYATQDTDNIKENRVQLKNTLIKNRLLPKGESGARVKDYTEMVLLKHLRKTPGARVTLREIFSKAGRSVQELKPCFLMGPQAVAQYLSPSEFDFDVLIIDEGSQMRLEHALGAIARSKQIVVVGDPEQLGPSNSFYGVHKETDNWAILESESVLTWAASKYKESSLGWHYRSKHQSLIDFSNKTFYSNKLTVVPSAELKSEKLGLNYHFIEKSNYANSINMAEVDAIVTRAVSFMKTNSNYSLGIVALNLYQAEAIEKEIEQISLTDPCVSDYIKKWEEKNEGFFVKNLENVQGDERDIILISLTFGKNSSTGVLGQNFGLISREDGGRRLNVLVTRAKSAMHIFSSMKAGEIKEEAKTPRGTVVLKRFLEYCESSGKNGVPDSVNPPESPFEKAICSLLDKSGYKYTCQLGVSGYRIDIAVKNPYQNSYLVAIECDGASYHSAKSVKDRDKLRQSVLEDRGWSGKIYRIWSVDWFKNPHKEAEKLMDFIAKAEIDFAS